MVLNVAKPMLVSDVVGPPLDSGALDLDGTAAVAADEVVVVAHRAASVGGFAVVGADQVELAGVGHHQQRAVHSCQPDVLALVPEIVVDLTGRAEVVGAGEQAGYGGVAAFAVAQLPRRPPAPGGSHRTTIRQALSITTESCR
jgi:hypothetical protein